MELKEMSNERLLTEFDGSIHVAIQLFGKDTTPEVEEIRVELLSRLPTRDKIIQDTGGGCSICGQTPAVNVSGTYWLCGDCVSEKLAENHDWYCGCDHWNGSNLPFCARCGRRPKET